ncbi:MAG: hypothetical protein KDK45_19670, partial [Leptospiraceae bacterium]|nr:hypothetical protein [Leptospiraceae bacterium]
KTKAARMGNKVNTILENRFAYYRDKIRKEIDEPMLKITYPSGSILENVILEQKNNGYYLGRQLGSYPITVKIPAPKNELPLKNKPVNILITGHAERSIKGLSYPINPNSLTDLCYREIPGISKTLASKTILSSPFSNEKEFAEKAPEAYHHTIKLTKEIIFH